MQNRFNLQMFPMLRVATALIAGMVLGGVIVSFLWFWLFVGALLGALLAHRRRIVQGGLLLVAVGCLGGWLMSEAERRLAATQPSVEMTYEAVVFSEPVVRGKTIQCDLLLVGEGSPLKVKASILRDTVARRYARLHVGDGIRARSFMESPRNYHGASFDYARWLRTHGYRAQTFVYYSDWQKAAVDLSALSPVDRLRLRAMRLRRQLVARYLSAGLDERQTAVLAAMTLGDKTAIDQTLRNDYAVSGASHVLALSGLHLGIVYFMFSLLTLRRRRSAIAQVLLLVGIWAYVFLVGLPPSAVRSATMLSIYGVVTLLGRSRMSLNALATAAVVMLVVRPANLYDIGFRLSFLAVLAILMWAPLLYGLLPRRWTAAVPPLRWLWGMLVVSVAAQIGTAPLIVDAFGRFPSYFLLTNLLAIPCVTIILCLSVVFFLTLWLPVVPQVVAQGLAWLTDLMNGGIGWIAALPGASVYWQSLSDWQVFAAYLLILSAWLGIRLLANRPRNRAFPASGSVP